MRTYLIINNDKIGFAKEDHRIAGTRFLSLTEENNQAINFLIFSYEYIITRRKHIYPNRESWCDHFVREPCK